MSTLRFGSFELDQRASELRRGGSRLRLRAQPLRVLQLLVEHAGYLVTRERVKERLWPDDTFVASDVAINKAVSELRAVLGDSAAHPRFIETLSKRGYRFVCPVTHIAFSGPRGSESALGEAHRVCRIGRYLWSRRTLPDLHASIGWFHQALELEERCAFAHAGLADANVLLGIWGLQPHDLAFVTARRSADRALALDPGLAEAHVSLAEVVKGYEWNWSRAERRYQHALSLNPGCVSAHHGYAQLLVVLRRYREAAVHIELARRADPVSPAVNAYLPYIYLAGRAYDRARDEAKWAVDLEPHSPLAHWFLGRALLFSNEVPSAVGALQRAATLAAGASMWTAELAYAKARAGDRAGASALLAELIERSRHTFVSSYDLAIAHAGLGDRGPALDHLEQAFAQREMRVISLGDPEFDHLQADPRFKRLVHRLALPSLQP